MLSPIDAKDKLPKGFTYAASAKTLSEFFEGAAEGGTLRVRYLGRPGQDARLNGHARINGKHPKPFNLAHDGRPYPVFAAHYEPQPDALPRSEGDADPAAWQLNVYPVPCERKRAVLDALEDHGFLAVGSWLRATRSATWLESPHRIVCVFDPPEGELEVIEADL